MSHESREWWFYLDDMLAFCENVLAFTDGYSQQAFETDRKTYDATVRNLELIGETATHIPTEVRAATPDIEWRQVIALRNRLIHAYLGIDNDVLWSIIQTDVPELLNALQKMKGDYSS